MGQVSTSREMRMPTVYKNKSFFARGSVTDNGPLPAVETLGEMRRELEAALLPMGKEAAKEMARMMFGQYPRAKVDDPDVYLRGILSVFVDMPKDLCAQAVDDITRHRKFIPNRAEVYEVTDALVKRRQGQLGLVMRAMREQDRRAQEAERDALIERDKDKFRAKYGGMTGRDIMREAARKMEMSAQTPQATEEKNERNSTNGNPIEN